MDARKDEKANNKTRPVVCCFFGPAAACRPFPCTPACFLEAENALTGAAWPIAMGEGATVGFWPCIMVLTDDSSWLLEYECDEGASHHGATSLLRQPTFFQLFKNKRGRGKGTCVCVRVSECVCHRTAVLDTQRPRKKHVADDRSGVR